MRFCLAVLVLASCSARPHEQHNCLNSAVGARKLFASADRNHDSKISVSEWNYAIEQSVRNLPGPEADRQASARDQEAEFRQRDRDGDGELTLEEFRAHSNVLPVKC